MVNFSGRMHGRVRLRDPPVSGHRYPCPGRVHPRVVLVRNLAMTEAHAAIDTADDSAVIQRGPMCAWALVADVAEKRIRVVHLGFKAVL